MKMVAFSSIKVFFNFFKISPLFLEYRPWTQFKFNVKYCYAPINGILILFCLFIASAYK